MHASRLDPHGEFLASIPDEVKTGIEDLVFGNPLILGLKGLKAKEHPLVISESLVFALMESNRLLAEEGFAQPEEAQLWLRVGDWVRSTMDSLYREQAFPHLTAYYQNVLTLNTREGLLSEFENLHPSVSSRLLGMLQGLVSAGRVQSGTPLELIALGGLLGKTLEGTTLSLLSYAQSRRFLAEDVWRGLGVDPERVEEFRLFMRLAHRQDLTAFSRGEVLELLERHRAMDRLIRSSSERWGETHPLNLGFEKAYFDEDDPRPEERHLEALLNELRAYLGLRH